MSKEITIGIIKEGKNPPDRRVPFTPEHCKALVEKFPQVEIQVQKSSIRAFSDDEYVAKNLKLVEDLKDAAVIFGVKEVLIKDLIPNKTYFFFSHTIKKQPYNRDLLRAVLEKNIQLVDYECLTTKDGQRIIGFGRYAGIVGTYNGFLAFGKRSNSFQLKPAHLCKNKVELLEELKKVVLPENFKIAITGLGRVAGGALEIFQALNLKQVSPSEYLTSNFSEPVFTQLSVEEYFKKPSNELFEREEVFQFPERFENNFMPYARETDLYISCHFWDSKGPVIFTKEEMKSSDFRIRTIADISCDIDGPIPSTIRPSTIDDPIYEVDRISGDELTENADKENSITVMAVDNLPCELPRDASEGFGKDLLEKVIPNLLGEDEDQVFERACIAANGKLMPNFKYLEDYVKGI